MRMIIPFAFTSILLCAACRQDDQPVTTSTQPAEETPLNATVPTTPLADTLILQPETELERLLSELNSWPTEELDAYERPEEYPGFKTSGETNGWVDTHKERIKDEGARVKWNVEKMRYELQ